MPSLFSHDDDFINNIKYTTVDGMFELNLQVTRFMQWFFGFYPIFTLLEPFDSSYQAHSIFQVTTNILLFYLFYVDTPFWFLFLLRVMWIMYLRHKPFLGEFREKGNFCEIKFKVSKFVTPIAGKFLCGS